MTATTDRACPGGALGQPLLDCDGAAGEEHRIDREYVVILGVRDFHQHEKDDKRQPEHPPAAVAEKPDQAREPDRQQDRVHVDDLLLNEREWSEHDVLAFPADVGEVFNRREVMADLPDDVREEKRESDRAGDPNPRSSELAAMMRQKQGDGDRESERQRGVFVLKAETGKDAEP